MTLSSWHRTGPLKQGRAKSPGVANGRAAVQRVRAAPRSLSNRSARASPSARSSARASIRRGRHNQIARIYGAPPGPDALRGAGSIAWPSRGITSCALPFVPSDSSVSAGSSQACSARLKVPQCTGRKAPPPSRSSAFNAFAGPRWMWPHDGWKAPTFEHHQVERAQAISNGRVFAGEPGVAAEEHRMALRPQGKRGPQRRIAVAQAAAREVLRRRGRHRDFGLAVARHDAGRLPPVELGDALVRHAPGFEVCADTERGDEAGIALASSRIAGSRGGRSGRARPAPGRSAAARSARPAPAGSASGRPSATVTRAAPRPGR